MFMVFSRSELNQEATRLQKKLGILGWSKADCLLYAPLTLEINTLKREKKAIILAHSYQTPDIMYGVADFLGDSYGLSKIAANHPAPVILFASVYFMAETAKILSPEKTVLVPGRAGCSLADSIQPEDVRKLKLLHPGAPVVCYINTSAAVKAEADICCTSANARTIIESLDAPKIIFIPDEFMAQNLAKESQKTIIGWPGRCVVHESFNPESIAEIRHLHPGVKILTHLECSPAVTEIADFTGSTSSIIAYVQENKADSYMIVTECGITDRLQSEQPDKKIVGACALCPYMKQIDLKGILSALKNPSPRQIINLPAEIMAKARQSLDLMLEYSKN